MRILIINTGVPEPTFGAGKRVFHLSRALIEAGHELHMLVAISKEEQPRLTALETHGFHFHPVLLPPPPKTPPTRRIIEKAARRVDAAWRFRRASLRAMGDPLPRDAKAHWVAPLRRGLRDLLRRQSFDAVIVEHEENALLAHEIPQNIPVILDAHNVLSSMVERDVNLQGWRDRFDLHRLSVRVQPAKLRRFERWMVNRYDAVVAMSQRETQTLRDSVRDMEPEVAARIHVIENGVDVANYSSTRPVPDNNRLIFTGLMSWSPNDDAMQWFGREVWPLIVAARPETRLDIVGAEPSPAVRALAGDSRIRVTGRVERVQPYFEEASVMIVPLRKGGGTRLKILEAAAMGRPIVSTRVGAEGLDKLHDGKHLLLRDSPSEFAEGVVELLENRERSRQMADAARQVVEAHYDWNGLGGKFEQLVASQKK